MGFGATNQEVTRGPARQTVSSTRSGLQASVGRHIGGLRVYASKGQVQCGCRMLAGRVEDWRGVPKVWPSLLLPVSVGSASIAEP
jgi:hypothetical protein